MADIYKKILPKEVQENLKASEIRDLRETENAMNGIIMGSIFFGFTWIVILIAFILWMNKFTLFIFLVSSLLIVFLITIGAINYKAYKKMLKTIIEQDVEG